MIANFVLGATFGFAAAVQPGPLQAYIIAQSASHGWRRALPAAFSPLLSDGPIVLVTVLALSRLPAWFTQWVRIAGGLFVLYLAFSAFRTWRSEKKAAAAPSGQESLLKGALVNLLNPNPWISWSLVLGPLLIKGWREAPGHGIGLLAGFYGVLIGGLAGTAALFGAAGKFSRGLSRALVGISAAALAIFGLYLVWSGF